MTNYLSQTIRHNIPAKQVLFIGIALVSLVGCTGTEVGRISFEALEPQDISLSLGKKQVYFWVDLDVSYEGPLTLGYDITLEQAGETVAQTRCNALELNPKMAVEITVNGRNNKRYRGKMDCSVELSSLSDETTFLAS